MNRFIYTKTMPQISKHKLDKTLEEEIFLQFWTSVSKLRDAGVAASFFSDLLSDTEEIMLAKRFAVAILILRGKRPIDITGTLHVSYSTIRSVASWLKNAKPKTRQVLQSMIQQGKWQNIFDRVDALLEELPPVYGTNWSKAGQAKFQRKMERTSRQSLR
jgi:uncharacterized protein YerC